MEKDEDKKIIIEDLEDNCHVQGTKCKIFNMIKRSCKVFETKGTSICDRTRKNYMDSLEDSKEDDF
jgi:hypothetical protein